MNSGFGNFGNFGTQAPTFDFGPMPDFNFEFVPYDEQGPSKAQKSAQASQIATSVLDLVGAGISVFSSVQDRKSAEAQAQAAIAQAATAGQISASQAAMAQAQVSAQLGLAQSEADVKKTTQKTILYSVLAVVVVGGLLGGIALARR